MKALHDDFSELAYELGKGCSLCQQQYAVCLVNLFRKNWTLKKILISSLAYGPLLLDILL